MHVCMYILGYGESFPVYFIPNQLIKNLEFLIVQDNFMNFDVSLSNYIHTKTHPTYDAICSFTSTPIASDNCVNICI